MNIKSYRIDVPQSVLDDLHERLARTRWPQEIEGVGWDYGTDRDFLQQLVQYWRDGYDWRVQEAALNRFTWYETEIDEVQLRFIHERGKGPNTIPLLLFHGWPDSYYRYHKLIPMLTDPAAYGADPAVSFDVIVPAMHHLSGGEKLRVRKQVLKQNAELAYRLMTDGLGYQRFGAGGGDGGSPQSQVLAVDHPETILGIHLTDIGFHSMRGPYTDLSEAEKAFFQASQAATMEEGAYALQQGTKPQTLAFGLNDSPVGWAGWVIEKFRTWSDCGGNPENVYTKDELLTNLMIHWVDGIDPRGYREEWTAPSLVYNQRVDVPVGLAHPPHDLTPVPPREFAERNLKDIRRWTVLPRGGHFLAMEDPAALAAELRAFFAELRD